jgi:hypothetical protein
MDPRAGAWLVSLRCYILEAIRLRLFLICVELCFSDNTNIPHRLILLVFLPFFRDCLEVRFFHTGLWPLHLSQGNISRHSRRVGYFLLFYVYDSVANISFVSLDTLFPPSPFKFQTIYYARLRCHPQLPRLSRRCPPRSTPQGRYILPICESDLCSQ